MCQATTVQKDPQQAYDRGHGEQPCVGLELTAPSVGDGAAQWVRTGGAVDAPATGLVDPDQAARMQPGAVDFRGDERPALRIAVQLYRGGCR